MTLSRQIFTTLEVISGIRGIPKHPLRSLVFKQLQALCSSENIIGFGAAEKRVNSVGVSEGGIVFYVKKKKARKTLSADDFIPPVISGTRASAIFTDVVQVGKVVAHVSAQTDPIQTGYSIGHENGKPGTLAAIVFKNGEVFGLSAQHVLANSDRGSVGDRIIFPARADGGTLADTIGTLGGYTPLIRGPGYPNKMDAALCLLDEDSVPRVLPSITNEQKPLEIADPIPNMQVRLSGRSSGTVSSVVNGIACCARIYQPGLGFIGFRDLIECSPFAEFGDSGALVVDTNSQKAVGIHVGGSSSASFFVPIRTVATNLEFDTN